MIKVTMGEICTDKTGTVPALGEVFGVKFKDFKTIKSLLKLQKMVIEKSEEFKELQDKVVEANGTKNEEGKKTLSPQHPAFIELFTSETELDIDKIIITEEACQEADYFPSATICLVLEKLIEFEGVS